MNSTNTSSISSVSTNYRQKGKLPSANAKVYKGFIHDATSKLSVGSIPAKFETIVTRHQSQKAFGASSQRFQSDMTEVPGPQEYELSMQSKGPESYSVKGWGGLISNQEREVFKPRYVNSGPGPGSYQEASFFNNSMQSKSSTALKSSTIKKQSTSAEPTKLKVIHPGPGEYDGHLPQPKLNTYKSSFISKVKRDTYMRRQEVPAPGIYNPTTPDYHEQIGPTSSFYPEINHRKPETTLQRLSYFLEDKKERELRAKSPGPCDYSPKEPSFKPEYAESSEMGVFKKLSKDRFGDPVDPNKRLLDPMGPGIYDLKSQFNQEQTLVSGSAFMSEQLRKPFGEYDKRFGPNLMVPALPPRKKNYHLNLQQKWM